MVLRFHSVRCTVTLHDKSKPYSPPREHYECTKCGAVGPQLASLDYLARTGGCPRASE